MPQGLTGLTSFSTDADPKSVKCQGGRCHGVRRRSSEVATLVIWDSYQDHQASLGVTTPDALIECSARTARAIRQVIITSSVRRLGRAPGIDERGRVQNALFCSHDQTTATHAQ
jgi:hypothetical protein